MDSHSGHVCGCGNYMHYRRTGSKYFFGMLFMCMIVPVLLWAMMFFAGLFKRRGEELAEEQKKDTIHGTEDEIKENAASDEKKD